MDEAITNLRTMKESRDAVFSFHTRVADLRKELIAASDELHRLRRHELSHYNDDAQEELRKAFGLLWESQNNLDKAGTHTVKAHNVHVVTVAYQRLG